MKKILTVVAFLFAGAASADTINWIVPGSATGVFNMLSKIYAQEIQKQGVDIRVDVAGNCVNGMTQFRQSTKPVAMIYTLDANDIALRKGCEFESVAALTQSVSNHLMSGMAAVCTMDNNLDVAHLRKGNEFTVAVDNARYSRMSSAFTELGVKFRAVRYDNSGSAVRGMMGGDTNISFTSAGQSESVIKAGGKCLFVVGDKPFSNIPSTKQLFNIDVNYNDNTYVLLIKNMSGDQKQQLIAAVETVKNSDQLRTYAQNKWLIVPINTDINLLIQQAVNELF
jgi:tripartite-type tricarboxylate transporter receptor subunit TctC